MVVFIDIFPVDNIVDDKAKLSRQLKAINNTRMIMNLYARYYSGLGVECMSRVKSLIYCMFVPLFACNILDGSKLYKRYDKICQRYNDCCCLNVGDLAENDFSSHVVFEKKLFANGATRSEFAGRKFCIPKSYDEILRSTYGDYMTPRQAPTAHGDTIYANIPYEEYLHKNKAKIKQWWREGMEKRSR